MENLGRTILIALVLVSLITALPSLKLRDLKGYANGIGSIACAMLFGLVYLIYCVGLPMSDLQRETDALKLARMIAKQMAKGK